MTANLRLVWAAVYAQCWERPFSTEYGVMTDEYRTAYAIKQANKAVASLQAIANTKDTVDLFVWQAAREMSE